MFYNCASFRECQLRSCKNKFSFSIESRMFEVQLHHEYLLPRFIPYLPPVFPLHNSTMKIRCALSTRISVRQFSRVYLLRSSTMYVLSTVSSDRSAVQFHKTCKMHSFIRRAAVQFHQTGKMPTLIIQLCCTVSPCRPNAEVHQEDWLRSFTAHLHRRWRPRSTLSSTLEIKTKHTWWHH